MKRKGDALIGIGTGCNLMGEYWRQHSWGVRKNGLLETLGERESYWGIVPTGIDVDMFAFQAVVQDESYWDLLQDQGLHERVRAEIQRSMIAAEEAA